MSQVFLIYPYRFWFFNSTFLLIFA
ncbi:hypothetical protein RDI58_020673 [Solanum bulbocastanum]|uniref:Uncharacterized protein n=1 Tax=Solanum bulbocastanum TaxID=147425 RepID=A0AAN8Y848_SOLBU